MSQVHNFSPLKIIFLMELSIYYLTGQRNYATFLFVDISQIYHRGKRLFLEEELTHAQGAPNSAVQRQDRAREGGNTVKPFLDEEFLLDTDTAQTL